MFNALNLQQYYYPIGATGDADQGGRRPPAIAPVGTILPPKFANLHLKYLLQKVPQQHQLP
jgi:hypothetical protein